MYRVTFLLFLLLQISVFAQKNKTIDSLEALLTQTRNDTEKVNILLQLAHAQSQNSPQQAFIHAQRALGLAQTSGDAEIISDSYFTLGNIYHRTAEYDSAKHYYNEASQFAFTPEMQTKIFDNTGILFRDMGNFSSALLFHNQSLRLKETLGDREAVAVSYHNIGSVYFHMKQFSDALTYYYFALEIRKLLNDQPAIAASLNNIGDTYRNAGNFDNAIQAYEEALGIQQTIGNKQTIANTLHNIGNFYFHLRIYDKAQEYYSKALEIRIELGNKNDIAASRFNMATVHRDLGNFNEALKYYTMALELRKETENRVAEALTLTAIAGLYKNNKEFSQAITYYMLALGMQKEIGNTPDIATLYERIGITYKDTLLYNEALEYYTKAKSIYIDLQNNTGIARIHNYIGNLFRDQALFEQALKEYEQAYALQLELSDIRGMAYTKHNMAELFVNQSNYTKALSLFTDALELAQNISENTLVEHISYSLYTIYKKVGNFQKSLSYLELHNTIQESLAQDRTLRRIAELEFESNIRLLEQINEIQELKIREEQTKRTQQRVLLIIVIIVALLILAFSVMLYRQFSQKALAFNLLSKSRKELEETYHQLERTHELLQEKNQKLTDSLNYATRIQKAILPTEASIKNIFPKHFIYYLPRDIVSGDFYWFAEQKDFAFIAAIDCTGHGIPGAFMSMVGNTLLNQIVNELHIYEPQDILNRLDHEIIQTLKQYDEDSKQEDGLDISLLRYNTKTKELLFAGAGQKAITILDSEIKIYATSQFSIGGMHSIKKEQNLSFTQTEIPISKGMRIFICSDGFIDQFGGEKDERFTSNRFHSLLKNTVHLDIAEQHTELSKQFDEWQGTRPQIDDVIVIGIEF